MLSRQRERERSTTNRQARKLCIMRVHAPVFQPQMLSPNQLAMQRGGRGEMVVLEEDLDSLSPCPTSHLPFLLRANYRLTSKEADLL